MMSTINLIWADILEALREKEMMRHRGVSRDCWSSLSVLPLLFLVSIAFSIIQPAVVASAHNINVAFAASPRRASAGPINGVKQVTTDYCSPTTANSQPLSRAFSAPSPFLVAGVVVMVATTTAFLPTVATAAPYFADLGHGAALFQANCAGCHAGGLNFVSEKKTLKKEALEKYKRLDQATIQKFVQTGMPHRMLPLKDMEGDQDYFDVTSFVMDQALNDKW